MNGRFILDNRIFYYRDFVVWLVNWGLLNLMSDKYKLLVMLIDCFFILFYNIDRIDQQFNKKMDDHFTFVMDFNVIHFGYITKLSFEISKFYKYSISTLTRYFNI